MNAYAALEAHYGRIGRLDDALEILFWDMATMMPKGGAEGRAETLATMKVLRHELAADPALAERFEGAAGQELDAWQQANLREMKRAYAHATAVPGDLVEALSKAGSACEMTWREARPANDFARLAPKLAEVFRLVREVANVKAAALGVSPYEALLDQYEPGGSAARIDAVFDDLASSLPALIEQVIAHQAKRPAVIRPDGPFPIDRQRALGVKVMGTLGFDFDHGRLDVSHHPFCGGTADDVRITTRYDEGDFTKALMGVIHETGHALYERGRPARWRFQPVGVARGMSVHESQSLLMEMQACRSREFIGYVTPLLRDTFGGEGAAWSVDNLHRLYTQVRRGLIRVDADEVTYPAHVVLRYRLERALLADDLQVQDLPGAWAEGMQTLLGVKPPDDRDGCMQDIHWMDGTVGYFPTYTLGAMTAAQLFDAATRADADILPGVGRGDFAPLLRWLRANVHQWGSLLSTDELLTQATGKPLDAAVFRAHLEKRYLGDA
ncbi:MAG: carboxypeptidase M32 [Myxococcales bacterium]|nr:carboxypeptidase M32 [Myxococcales bacterium]